MNVRAWAVCAAVMAGPAWAEDDAQAALTAKAEACITSHAAEVERAEPSLAAGVTFLAGDLCGGEIEVAERYRANVVWLAAQREQQRNLIAATAIQPPTLMVRPASAPTASAQVAGKTPPPVGAAPQRFDYEAAQARNRQSQQKKLDDLERASVDPHSGAIVGLSPTENPSEQFISVLRALTPATNVPPTRYRALAARALLAARQARSPRP